MTIANIIIGSIMITLGKKVYFLFVGGVGFISGIFIAQQYLGSTSPLMAIMLGLAAGLIGALFAIFLQKFTLIVAGGVSGIYIAQTIASYIPIHTGGQNWVLTAIGAIIGIGLMIVFFDLAIMFLSSFAGAFLIIGSFTMPILYALIGVAALTIFGLFIQNLLNG